MKNLTVQGWFSDRDRCLQCMLIVIVTVIAMHVDRDRDRHILNSISDMRFNVFVCVYLSVHTEHCSSRMYSHLNIRNVCKSGEAGN
jgi:hypothetical protein